MHALYQLSISHLKSAMFQSLKLFEPHAGPQEHLDFKAFQMRHVQLVPTLNVSPVLNKDGSVPMLF